MDELRKNNFIEMYFSEGKIVKGFVSEYTGNRVKITIADDFIETARKVNELDNLIVVAHTDYGIKKTYSCVIGKSKDGKFITIEKNPAIPVVQKREFVRISSNLNFKIRKNNKIYNCTCINISGGGVAFKSDEVSFDEGEEVEIIFKFSESEEEVLVSALIHKVQQDKIVARYINLNKYDESKIVKYVFKKSVKKPM